MAWRIPAVLSVLIAAAVAHGRPAALIVEVGDVHSAYDRMPQLVAAVDHLREANDGVPLAILVDGDLFEGGNAVARRSQGELEFALLGALAQRAPTVLTLGNHEPDILPLAAVVERVQRVGVRVLGGNVQDRARGTAWGAAAVDVPLGPARATIVGFTTDALATFPAAVRPTVVIADPVAWSREQLPKAWGQAAVRVVLSHAGLRADRAILPAVPDGTLYLGAHDHLRLIHHQGDTIYAQSGSWLECVTVARLTLTPARARWEVEQLPLSDRQPADATFAAHVRQVLTTYLTPEERATVGTSPEALSPPNAARFATEAARHTAGADVAVVGGTTFGDGLPRGPVSRYAFDSCVRFDGPLYGGETDGATLRRMLACANANGTTPFAERSGENLIATGATADQLDPARRYRFVTTDWIARHPERYLGADVPPLHPLANVRLKAAVLAALQGAPVR